MNQKSLIIGICVTVVWFLGITIFCIWANFGFANKDLNSLGDFLAGIFAPVAFFWLILGYVQQGKQLEQNTKALEQQERALQLQIDEMRESVKQQKEIASIQHEQFQSQLKMVEPLFVISKYKFEIFGSEIHQDNLYELKFKINSLKGKIYNFRILNRLNLPIFSIPEISSN